jgi:hypothetical protein
MHITYLYYHNNYKRIKLLYNQIVITNSQCIHHVSIEVNLKT